MNLYNYNTPVMEDENKPGGDLLDSIKDFGKFDKKFLEERKVFLWGVVDDDSAEKVVNRLLYLESIDPGKEIKFYINSPGGIVTSGMVIMDVMDLITAPVSTICMGLAASMGSLLLSNGTKGKRYIFPNGRVMIHQPSIGSAQGSASDLAITAREIKKTKELGARILAKNCDQDYDKVMKDFDRDFWLNAQESLDYGIVDGVVKNI